MKKKGPFLLLLLMTQANLLFACPLCTDLVSRSSDAIKALRFGQGIFWSILILLGTPFFLVSGVTVYLFLKTRNRKNLNVSL